MNRLAGIILLALLLLGAACAEERMNLAQLADTEIGFAYADAYNWMPNRFKPYDPESAALSGLILWTMSYEEKDVLCATRLDTGECRAYSFYAYPIQSDPELDGALLAEEKDGKVTLWHMDRAGNLSVFNTLEGIEPYLYTQSASSARFDYAVLAYCNDCLYYRRRVDREKTYFEYVCRRMDGTEYVYQGTTGCLSGSGRMAYFAKQKADGTKMLVIEGPETGVQETGICESQDMAIRTICWRDDDTLLFWSIDANDTSEKPYRMFSYHASDGTIAEVLNANGEAIASEVALYFGMICKDRYIVTSNQIAQVFDDLCGEPVLLDLQTGAHYSIVQPYNFVKRGYISGTIPMAYMLK